MTIRPEYFRYLDHLGPTVPVREMAADPSRRDMVALRHDVDHDLDTALEMAFQESRRGVRATYYVLHGGPYWQDPRLVEKCAQLQDFGHEVGLHLNALARWYAGETDDVAADVEATLRRLRDGGVRISGISAHGDRLCYEAGFINYWCMRDLRPERPEVQESGLSAEGVPAEAEARAIAYPGDGVVRRPDGAAFPLWSVEMRALGLEYHATHVRHDGYFTDSGGDWTRSADPMECDLREGRQQVLMHPIHWRSPPRLVFFLSAPRSGSLWLSRLLDQATSARGSHEFTLNHRFDGKTLTAAKRTADDFPALLERPDEARTLMLEARDYMEQSSKDWAEANVYLPHFPSLLEEIFPDAMLVHLHRDPGEVVRSLVNRDWYDTPDDPRHPRLDVEGWDDLDQFTKVCWYVRTVNEALAERCPRRLAFEAMISDIDYLTARLAELDIAFYPRLARELMGRPLNASRRYNFPPPDEWSDDDRATFDAICGPTAEILGYRQVAPSPARGDRPAPAAPAASCRRTLLRFQGTGAAGFSLAGIWRRRPGGLRCATRDCRLVPGAPEAPIRVRLPAGRHGHVLFNGGHWDRLRPGAGWKITPGTWYRGEVAADLPAGRSATVFCLMYDAEGRLMDKRPVASLSPEKGRRLLSFRPRAAAARFNLALYFPRREQRAEAVLRLVDLVEIGAAPPQPTIGHRDEAF